MSIDLYIFCLVVTFKILFVAVLSVATDVCGRGWPISARSVYMYVAFWQFSRNPPNLASVADAMAFLMILHSTCTGLFSGGIAVIGVLFLDFGPREKNSPDLLCAYGSEM